MTTTELHFHGIKSVALPVVDIVRARRFYGETLALPPAFEGGQEVGFLLGHVVLMLKRDWYAAPTDLPSPRVTLGVEDAPATEASLRALGVTISDPVQVYAEYHVGGFLDSEGNKLWFCSPIGGAA